MEIDLTGALNLVWAKESNGTKKSYGFKNSTYGIKLHA